MTLALNVLANVIVSSEKIVFLKLWCGVYHSVISAFTFGMHRLVDQSLHHYEYSHLIIILITNFYDQTLELIKTITLPAYITCCESCGDYVWIATETGEIFSVELSTLDLIGNWKASDNSISYIYSFGPQNSVVWSSSEFGDVASWSIQVCISKMTIIIIRIMKLKS